MALGRGSPEDPPTGELSELLGIDEVGAGLVSTGGAEVGAGWVSCTGAEEVGAGAGWVS